MAEQRDFSFDTGEERKQDGWNRVSLRDPTGSVLAYCVGIVQNQLRHRLTFTPDDAHNEYDKAGYPLPHYNLLGRAFATMRKEGIIIHTGQWVKSRRPEAHGREIRVYRHGRRWANEPRA